MKKNRYPVPQIIGAINAQGGAERGSTWVPPPQRPTVSKNEEFRLGVIIHFRPTRAALKGTDELGLSKPSKIAGFSVYDIAATYFKIFLKWSST